MATTTQDPAVQDPNAGVTDVSRSPKERIGGIISALTGAKGEGSLDDVINQHHQKRLDQARRSRQEWSTYHSVGLSGVYPEDYTDEQGVVHKAGEPLTPGDKARYQSWAEGAWADYEKAAGINPQAKKSLQQSKGIIDRVSQMFTQHQQGAGGDTAAPAGGLPAPPAAAPAGGGGEAPGNADAGGGLPAPPQASEPNRAQVSADAPRVQQKLDEERQFKFWKRQQDVLRENKIAENEALAKARASNQRAPRPAGSMSISVLDARSRAAASGTIFKGYDGTPIPIDDLDDTMGLKGMAVFNPEKNDWEIRYEPFSPNQKTVVAGNDVMAVSPMDLSKLPTGKAGVVLGVHSVPTTRMTTDPATGQTTVSVSTPSTPGLKAGGLPAPPSASAPASSPATAAPTGGGTTPRKAPAAASTPATLAASAAPPPLDDAGHIPAAAATSTPGLTPQVIEGANQLLDGSDKDKLPAKTRELSASLARKYGWEQGKFTPREQGALRNATQFIDDMIKDPATMAVLDSTASRLKLNQVMAGSNKQQGMVGGTLSTLAAGNMSDAEAQFVRNYNIIAQTIAGIAPAVRGTGSRTTEAAIQRLLTDMPNPRTVQGSKDGMARLKLLKKEIQRALAKGSFTDVAQAGKGGGLEKPPAAKGEATKPALSDAAKAYLKSQGIAVP